MAFHYHRRAISPRDGALLYPREAPGRLFVVRTLCTVGKLALDDMSLCLYVKNTDHCGGETRTRA